MIVSAVQLKQQVQILLGTERLRRSIDVAKESLRGGSLKVG
jgi:hypothetical protein